MATVIFLPLTVLAGYFVRRDATLTVINEDNADPSFSQGMNFTKMWTVKHGHSDIM